MIGWLWQSINRFRIGVFKIDININPGAPPFFSFSELRYNFHMPQLWGDPQLWGIFCQSRGGNLAVWEDEAVISRGGRCPGKETSSLACLGSSQPSHLLISVADPWNITTQNPCGLENQLNIPCWHYIQVDCEVTAMETAILGVLPGSVEFLTIPCVCVPWLPWFPCAPWARCCCCCCWLPWLFWDPLWVSWAMVLGPGRGEVNVRTTVDWTRALKKKKWNSVKNRFSSFSEQNFTSENRPPQCLLLVTRGSGGLRFPILRESNV